MTDGEDFIRAHWHAATAVLTARLQTLDGSCTLEEFAGILRRELDDHDAQTLIDAMSAISAVSLLTLSSATGNDAYLVLRKAGEVFLGRGD